MIRDRSPRVDVEGPGSDFNFITTTFKGLEREAARECAALLVKLGDSGPSVWATEVSGLLVGRTSLDGVKAVEGLKGMVADEPWSIRLVLRLIPVDKVTEAKPEAVKAVALELAGRVGAAESFRVTVEKRHNDIPTSEFVKAAASALKQKVDLEAPDWVVLVEVLRDVAGVSVLRPSSIFSSSRAKRGE